jgi:pimeloyl-ACP methyl ester carboxylesterase
MLDIDWRPPTHRGRPSFIRPTFEQWIEQKAEPRGYGCLSRPVQTRFHRNGFDWDMRGTLFEPAHGAAAKTGFVLLHGGAGSEMEFVETPDGRPGLAPVLAGEGFRTLALSFPGHLPKPGVWQQTVRARDPCYLLDENLPSAEVARRNIVCTFNTIVQGAVDLVDTHFDGDDVILFGHSTGGPMSVSLGQALKRASAIGIVGWGSAGPDGWYREWLDAHGVKAEENKPIGSVARRTAASFRQAGYEDDHDLTPWGDAEDYFRWADNYKAQFKTCLCDNQHGGSVERLVDYEGVTGLPRLEFVDHLFDPDPDYLRRISVLLLTGAKDRNHWNHGAADHGRLEHFMARKFAQRTARATLVVVPRFGHFGFVGKANHLIAHHWIDALKGGFFQI